MICKLCPRQCGAERTETQGGGVCRMPAHPVVARAALHRWEEPCLSGTCGAGAVFFSGCPLGCSFCQNRSISHECFGRSVSVSELRQLFERLIAQGAHNIDLVTPTHFTPWIRQALEEPLPVPVVWNSGGYERVETLRSLEGKVQIYLPDLKYALPELAKELSGAENYFEQSTQAILEMYRQVGAYRMEKGLLRSGVLIRHLLLPGQLENTRRCLDWIARTFSEGEVLVSLMRQYTPQAGAEGLLARRVTGAEYRAAVRYMESCGIVDGFLQDRESAEASYTPAFDLTGIDKADRL